MHQQPMGKCGEYDTDNNAKQPCWEKGAQDADVRGILAPAENEKASEGRKGCNRSGQESHVPSTFLRYDFCIHGLAFFGPVFTRSPVRKAKVAN
jgi:hypothetical protein